MGKRIERMKAGAKRLFRLRSSKSGLILSPEQAAADDPDTVEREAIKAGSLRGRRVNPDDLAGVTTLARGLAADAMIQLLVQTNLHAPGYPLRVNDPATERAKLSATSTFGVEVTVRIIDGENCHVR